MWVTHWLMGNNTHTIEKGNKPIIEKEIPPAPARPLLQQFLVFSGLKSNNTLHDALYATKEGDLKGKNTLNTVAEAFKFKRKNVLHAAAEAGNLVEVQSHVDNFDINVKDEKKKTALYLAAQNGHKDVVNLLLTLNAKVNIADVSIIYQQPFYHLLQLNMIINMTLLVVFTPPLPCNLCCSSPHVLFLLEPTHNIHVLVYTSTFHTRTLSFLPPFHVPTFFFPLLPHPLSISHQPCILSYVLLWLLLLLLFPKER